MNDSQQVGADVARALGFNPKEFLEINLRFRAGDLLVVDAQQLVRGDRLKKVADEIVNRKFVFREIEDDGAPVAVPAETPTMQPVAWAVESCRGIEGIYCLQSIACDRATHWGEKGRVFPLYAAPVAAPSAHVVVPEASPPLEAMPLPVPQVTHGDGDRQNNPDAGEASEELWHKVYGLSAQGNAILADALQKAASENATLRSEVERLRLQPLASAGSHVELHRAVRELLDGVNARYAKNPREWTCPHMQALDDMTQSEPQPTLADDERAAAGVTKPCRIRYEK